MRYRRTFSVPALCTDYQAPPIQLHNVGNLPGKGAQCLRCVGSAGVQPEVQSFRYSPELLSGSVEEEDLSVTETSPFHGRIMAVSGVMEPHDVTQDNDWIGFFRFRMEGSKPTCSSSDVRRPCWCWQFRGHFHKLGTVATC